MHPVGLSFFYPSKGNFIAFVSDINSRTFLKDVVVEFRKNSSIPSEIFSGPRWVRGVSWSDHWSFWQTGVQAIMITDTAPYRNPNYHNIFDTFGTINYLYFTKVVSALIPVVKKLIIPSI